MRVAAVDIGTNSTRLLVAEAGTDGGFTTLDRQVRITRLGQDVDATGRLADQAIARTVAAVAHYASVWRSLGVERVRVTATSAARDSANAADFASAIKAVAGVAPEVLDGDEEAATSFRGAAGAVDAAGQVCVLDIGGGSTELIRGRHRPEAAASRQLGCVRLTERAFDGDPPSTAAIAAAQLLVDVELDQAARLVDPAAATTLVAVAGTATTLAALYLDLPTYEAGRLHGTRMPAAAVAALAVRLLAMPSVEIAALGPVEGGREDVLAAGALILSAVVQRFGFTEVVVSEADILDGLVLGLVATALQDTPQPIAAAAQLVEVVDVDGTVIDVLPRAEVRRTGARHRCTYVAVVRSSGAVVVHRRAAWKDVSPLAWDLAFGGLCDVGEGWTEAAERELAEEAGLTGVDLIDLGRVTWSDDRAALVGQVFVALWDGPLHPADGEVVALAEVPAVELADWVARTDTVADSPDVVLPLLLRHLGL